MYLCSARDMGALFDRKAMDIAYIIVGFRNICDVDYAGARRSTIS
jgi:hypothetical protein